MAAKGGSSPNQALIIFLVFFILATITLGVTTYLGFDSAAKAAEADKKAQADAKKQEAEADYQKFQAMYFRTLMGRPAPKDAEAIETLRAKWDRSELQNRSNDPSKQDVINLIAATDKEFEWNTGAKKPARTFETIRADKEKELAAVTKNATALKKDVEQLRQDNQAAQDELKKARDTYAADLKKAREKAETDLAKYIDTIKDLQGQLDAKGKDIEKMTADVAALKEDHEKEVAGLTKQINQLKTRVARSEAQVAQGTTTSLSDSDQPKGRIDSIAPNGSSVFINLGSADNVKPQLTFSVYGVGSDNRPISFPVTDRDGKPKVGSDGKPEREGKATIEVTNVLGEHVSQAQVTRVRDPNRDPITRGDLLFNPAWSPNQRQHVAVAGLIDLTGEGRDNTQEFLRNLERQGIIIDAYLDLRDLTVKGKGIDRQTDFLILGVAPEAKAPGIRGAADEDPKVKRNTEIINEMTKMQEQAVANGVRVMSLKNFAAMSGYRLPKAVGTGQTEYKFEPSASGPAPKKEEKKDDKEAPMENKDEKKKDKENKDK
jgi:hypothetical protein